MRWIIALLVIAATGCNANYKQTVLIEPKSRMEAGMPVVIATPADGAYGVRPYKNSGRMVAAALREAIISHSKQADIAEESSGTGLDRFSVDKYRYYIEPTILHWEDRATEWSGKSDRITVQIDLFDLQTHDKIAASVIEGKSKWATFGGDHPQDLLLDPFRQYFDQLYGE